MIEERDSGISDKLSKYFRSGERSYYVCEDRRVKSPGNFPQPFELREFRIEPITTGTAFTTEDTEKFSRDTVDFTNASYTTCNDNSVLRHWRTLQHKIRIIICVYMGAH